MSKPVGYGLPKPNLKKPISKPKKAPVPSPAQKLAKQPNNKPVKTSTKPLPTGTIRQANWWDAVRNNPLVRTASSYFNYQPISFKDPFRLNAIKKMPMGPERTGQALGYVATVAGIPSGLRSGMAMLKNPKAVWQTVKTLPGAAWNAAKQVPGTLKKAPAMAKAGVGYLRNTPLAQQASNVKKGFNQGLQAIQGVFKPGKSSVIKKLENSDKVVQNRNKWLAWSKEGLLDNAHIPHYQGSDVSRRYYQHHQISAQAAYVPEKAAKIIQEKLGVPVVVKPGITVSEARDEIRSYRYLTNREVEEFRKSGATGLLTGFHGNNFGKNWTGYVFPRSSTPGVYIHHNQNGLGPVLISNMVKQHPELGTSPAVLSCSDAVYSFGSSPLTAKLYNPKTYRQKLISPQEVQEHLERHFSGHQKKAFRGLESELQKKGYYLNSNNEIIKGKPPVK